MSLMKWVLTSLSALLLVSLLVGALMIAAAMTWGAPFEHAVITVDDTHFTLGELGAGHWLLAFAGIAIACAVVLLIVPIAVVLPLAFAAVAVTVALAFAAAVLVIVFSPLILIGWLTWRLARGDSRRTQAPATIAG